jgi:MoxR-like ATPase
MRRDRTLHLADGRAHLHTVLGVEAVLAAREEASRVHLAESIEAYIVALVRATREPGRLRAEWGNAVEVGASPRASLALAHASAALAYLRGREYVTPDDVREIAPDVLRHRIVLSLDARLKKLSRDELIAGLIAAVPAP